MQTCGVKTRKGQQSEGSLGKLACDARGTASLVTQTVQGTRGNWVIHFLGTPFVRSRVSSRLLAGLRRVLKCSCTRDTAGSRLHRVKTDLLRKFYRVGPTGYGDSLLQLPSDFRSSPFFVPRSPSAANSRQVVAFTLKGIKK